MTAVAAGFADGDNAGEGRASALQYSGEVTKVGVKYVTGDLTFNVGYSAGESTDNTAGNSGGASDSLDTTSASVSYAVASGVTAILGYPLQKQDEGVN